MKRGHRVLDSDEAAALIRAAGAGWASRRRPSASPVHVRDQAMLATIYRAALRVSEALALRPDDVREDGRVHVRHGKGDRARWVAIDGAAITAVNAWRDVRAGFNFGPGALLFCSLPLGRGRATGGGGPLDPAYVRRLVTRLAEATGIGGDPPPHPHGFRHGRARELADGHMPVHYLRDYLGHSNISVTDAYLRQIGSRAVLDSARDPGWTF